MYQVPQSCSFETTKSATKRLTALPVPESRAKLMWGPSPGTERCRVGTPCFVVYLLRTTLSSYFLFDIPLGHLNNHPELITCKHWRLSLLSPKNRYHTYCALSCAHPPHYRRIYPTSYTLPLDASCLQSQSRRHHVCCRQEATWWRWPNLPRRNHNIAQRLALAIRLPTQLDFVSRRPRTHTLNPHGNPSVGPSCSRRS